MNTSKHQAYTYLIRFIPTGQYYFGVRTAKGCHPDELWVRYFTSSNVVKALIKMHGKASFEILETFPSSLDRATAFEEQVLVFFDAANSDEWLNRHNGGKNFNTTGMHAGENHPMFGKQHTEEAKQKISDARIGKYTGEDNHMFSRREELSPLFGRKATPEMLLKMRGENNPNFGKTGANHPQAKTYIITFPDGHEETITGLAEFCRNNELNAASMTGVAQGVHKTHHGFGCRYAAGQVGSAYKHTQGWKISSTKKYIITYPDGHEETITGLAEFCRRQNLHDGHMINVAKGKAKHHKGFLCRYAETA